MNKTFIPPTAISILFLTGVVFFLALNNRKLLKEKELLILRNDSLQIKQLKTKTELSLAQKRLDSLLKYKAKNI